MSRDKGIMRNGPELLIKGPQESEVHFMETKLLEKLLAIGQLTRQQRKLVNAVLKRRKAKGNGKS